MAERRFSSTIAHQLQSSSWSDKWLFLILLAVGCAGMLVLWQLDLHQLVVTMWPVGCLLVYAGFLLVTKRYQIREDRAGDNLYYLGFLFTLVSLAHALIEVAGEDYGTPEVIITDFGIALSTTIVGLALRVIFNQLREDPIETERTARQELSESVGKLKAELGGMVLDVNGYRREITQSIEELHKESKNAIEGVIKESTASYQRLVGELSQKITESTDGVQQAIGTLTGATAQAGDSIAEFSSKVDNIQVPSDLVERAINKPFEKINLLLQEITERQKEESQIVEGLSNAIQQANNSADNLKKTIDALEQLTIPDDVITNAIKPVFQEVQDLLENLRQRHESDSATFKELSTAMDGAATSSTQLQSSLKDVVSTTSTIAAMQAEFGTLAGSISKSTKDVNSVLLAHKELIQSLHEDVDSTKEKLRQYREELDSEIETVRSTNQHVFTQLAQLADTVVDKLNPRQ